MFCRTITSSLLNCITLTTQVAEGRKYFPRGPHVGQPCIKAWAYNLFGGRMLANPALKHGPTTFSWQRAMPFIKGWFEGRTWKITISGIRNHLNYWVIVIEYTEFHIWQQAASGTRAAIWKHMH